MKVDKAKAQEAAEDALRSTCKEWARETNRIATDEKNMLPALQSASSMYRNAAAIGMGMQAGRILFPDAAKAIANKLTVPLALTQLASQGLSQLL